MSRDIKVVYIVGVGRSGSTLVGDVLGDLPGWFHVGELGGLWRMLRPSRHVCSCGASVRDCEFWGGIVESAWGALDPETAASWAREVLRSRRVPGFLRASREAILAEPALAEYLELTRRLYQAVAESNNARVIVDSSKTPAHAALLRFIPGVDPYFVHLVRDARGVAYSDGKEESRAIGLRPLGPVTSARNWVMRNLGAEMIRRHSPSRSILVHYEDFAARPRETVAAILDLVHERATRLPFIDDRTVDLAPRHTLKGNLNRFVTGPMEIRRDDAWRSRLAPRRACLVTTLTLPLLLRYGYRVRWREGRR